MAGRGARAQKVLAKGSSCLHYGRRAFRRSLRVVGGRRRVPVLPPIPAGYPASSEGGRGPYDDRSYKPASPAPSGETSHQPVRDIPSSWSCEKGSKALCTTPDPRGSFRTNNR